MNHVMTMVRLRWIPSLFVLGFLVVIAVNTILIVKAMGTFSGLVVEHPYKKGAEYTQAQQALAVQKNLHWQYRMAAETLPDGRVKLVLDWTDEAGAPLQYLDVRVDFGRPVENLPPIKLPMIRQTGGRYQVLVALPRSGLWDLRFSAKQGDDRSFTAVERLLVP